MSDNTWHEVAAQSAVSEDEPIRVYVDKDEIAIFNVGGEFFATGNICTHAMASMHDGKFNIKTGEALCPPVSDPLPTYEVKVEDGKIFVKV